MSDLTRYGALSTSELVSIAERDARAFTDPLFAELVARLAGIPRGTQPALIPANADPGMEFRRWRQGRTPDASAPLYTDAHNVR